MAHSVRKSAETSEHVGTFATCIQESLKMKVESTRES